MAAPTAFSRHPRRDGCPHGSETGCRNASLRAMIEFERDREDTMQLTPDQRSQFQRDGLLFVPGLFRADEIAALKARLPEVLNARGPETLRERGSDAVRSSIAPHLRDDLYRRLSKHPRLVEPARQLLGGEVYLHQFKIN